MPDSEFYSPEKQSLKHLAALTNDPVLKLHIPNAMVVSIRRA